MNADPANQSIRCTACQVIDQVAADVVRWFLLVPEGARQEALLGALQGFLEQCRESEIPVSEQDQIYFVDVVLSQLETASAAVSAGNDQRRAS